MSITRNNDEGHIHWRGCMHACVCVCVCVCLHSIFGLLTLIMVG